MGRPGGCGKGVLATHTRWDRVHSHSRFQTDPSSPPCSLNKITFAFLLQPAWWEAVWTQQAWQRAWANKLCLRGGSEPPLSAYAYFWEDNVNMVKQKDGGKKRMEKKIIFPVNFSKEFGDWCRKTCGEKLHVWILFHVHREDRVTICQEY